MPKKSFTPEQIVTKLREIEVLTNQGTSIPAACNQAGVSDVSCYRWRKESGGLKPHQAQHPRDREPANLKERRHVAGRPLATQGLCFNPSPQRGLCFFGTFNPSLRQMSWTRSLPTCQPAICSSPVICR